MGIFAKLPISMRLVIVFGSIGMLMLILMAMVSSSLSAVDASLQAGRCSLPRCRTCWRMCTARAGGLWDWEEWCVRSV